MKILVVEDEAGIRAMVTSALKRAGYDIVEAKDGAEALQFLLSGLTVNALLTDIRMPEVDGWAVARAYREQFPDLPVVYVTGHSDEFLPVPGGVVIQKPYRISEVLPVLSKLIQPDRPQWGEIEEQPARRVNNGRSRS